MRVPSNLQFLVLNANMTRGGAGGPRADFAERGGGPAEGLGQIDTWNPIGSEKQEKQDQRLRHNKDAFENARNWGDDFPGKTSQSYWQTSWSKSDSLFRHWSLPSVS